MMPDKVNYEKSSGNKLFLLGFIYKLLIVDIEWYQTHDPWTSK